MQKNKGGACEEESKQRTKHANVENMKEKYESPLSSRYASDDMLRLFSEDTRYKTWRKLWVALAKTEMELHV